ncbi:MAG: hypothetical protein IKW37_01250 [Bacteroidaceae bacterium]|nr:hypothetical protein [Bacteroidaceae bacterium]
MAYVRKTDPVEKANRDKRIVELYKQGVPMVQIAKECHISKLSIRDIAKKHDVYIPSRHRILNGPNPQEALAQYYKDYEGRKQEQMNLETPNRMVGKLKTAILPSDIEMVRKSIKEGSKLNIYTVKAINMDGTAVSDNHAPTVRQATVISTNNKRFCIVRIDKTGLTEYVRWADIVIAMRNGKNYV